MSETGLYCTYYESPVGLIELTATGKGVSSLYFTERIHKASSLNKILTCCKKQLDEYFNEGRKEFSLPLDVEGTDFQKKVWNELLKIPYGKSISYIQLARRLGDEKLIRAVGTANGKNPVSIIVPCHRVIGSNGGLVGYGGGLYKKRWLLEFEGTLTQKELFA
jgi:methylated-DNA-[protein]-cysteine S-methyltransferase